MIVYIIWLIMVIAWNYGFPTASPFEDVLMAMIIGFIAFKLKKVLPDPTILKKNKYFDNKK